MGNNKRLEKLMGRYLSLMYESQEEFEKGQKATVALSMHTSRDKDISPKELLYFFSVIINTHLESKHEEIIAAFLSMMHVFEVDPYFKKIKEDADEMKEQLIKFLEEDEPVEN